MLQIISVLCVLVWSTAADRDISLCPINTILGGNLPTFYIKWLFNDKHVNE